MFILLYLLSFPSRPWAQGLLLLSVFCNRIFYFIKYSIILFYCFVVGLLVYFIFSFCLSFFLADFPVSVVSNIPVFLLFCFLYSLQTYIIFFCLYAFLFILYLSSSPFPSAVGLLLGSLQIFVTSLADININSHRRFILIP